MKRILLIATVVFLIGALRPMQAAAAEASHPQATTGKLVRIEMASALIGKRSVDVWLPQGYAEQTKSGQRYQVLYMHDGQMLFDAGSTWNKQAWQVDVALDRLMRSGEVAPTIVVGVWNAGKYRAAEYQPKAILDLLPEARRRSHMRELLEDRSQSDQYLRFLVQELKPLIDARFSTRPEPAATFVMGSSMGGLISLYAFTEYPHTFGGAASLSTHWIGSFKPNAWYPLAALQYLTQRLPRPCGKLYIDTGTEGLDALYGPAHALADRIVLDAGYADQSYLSRIFPGADHSESAWSKRLDIPLRFLLGGAKAEACTKR